MDWYDVLLVQNAPGKQSMFHTSISIDDVGSGKYFSLFDEPWSINCSCNAWFNSHWLAAATTWEMSSLELMYIFSPMREKFLLQRTMWCSLPIDYSRWDCEWCLTSILELLCSAFITFALPFGIEDTFVSSGIFFLCRSTNWTLYSLHNDTSRFIWFQILHKNVTSLQEILGREVACKKGLMGTAACIHVSFKLWMTGIQIQFSNLCPLIWSNRSSTTKKDNNWTNGVAQTSTPAKTLHLWALRFWALPGKQAVARLTKYWNLWHKTV